MDRGDLGAYRALYRLVVQDLLWWSRLMMPDSELSAILADVRATPGVRSSGVRSTAIGGTSVLTVSYSGSISGLADALRAKGFAVQQGPTALLISR